MRRAWMVLVGAAALAVGACQRDGDAGGGGEADGEAARQQALRTLEVPAEHQDGRQLFGTYCQSCHGEAALGTQAGPPLVHIVYEPNHHGDPAFYMAAENGVQAHHWNFGNMPPVQGVTREQVTEIIGYVRWMQQQAGIF